MNQSKKLNRAVGRSVWRMRQAAGLSQEAFGAKTQTDRTTICKIECGSMNLTIQKLCGICECMGITLKEFFSDEIYAGTFMERQ